MCSFAPCGEIKAKCSRLISTGEQHAGFNEQVKFTGHITTDVVSIINSLLLLSAATIISFSKKWKQTMSKCPGIVDSHMERQRGEQQQQGQTGGETGPSFFAYWVIPPSIDNLRVNHCALRADCVCLDRAKGREVVYRKSWGWYRSPFSIKTIMGSFFRQHAKLCQMKTRGRKEKKVYSYAFVCQLCICMKPAIRR